MKFEEVEMGLIGNRHHRPDRRLEPVGKKRITVFRHDRHPPDEPSQAA
jgi:hypothetical protein